jgi:UDP-glucuronate 4-epimerase
MRILVTGSSGQIGTNLALRLVRDGHDVFGVDKRLNTWTDEFRYLLQDLSGHYPSFPGGIGGVEYPDVDLVVHLAAHAKVHELVRQPHRALENAVMTFNVLEFCRQGGLPIVFSSSREVYGDVHRFSTQETQADFAYTESTYSASKIAGEAMIYSYARCYGLPYLVFRFSNVYGRYDNDLARMVRVIPLFIHTMRRDEPVTVFGAQKTLDFTYVDDCVDGIVCGIEALAERQVTNETINLAFGEGKTLVRAAELIASELGVEPRITLAPSLLGEVTHYVADTSKAKQLLGYAPKVPLDEGVGRAVAWFQEHRSTHPDEEEWVFSADARSPQDAELSWKSSPPVGAVSSR